MAQKDSHNTYPAVTSDIETTHMFHGQSLLILLVHKSHFAGYAPQ